MFISLVKEANAINKQKKHKTTESTGSARSERGSPSFASGIHQEYALKKPGSQETVPTQNTTQLHPPKKRHLGDLKYIGEKKRRGFHTPNP